MVEKLSYISDGARYITKRFQAKEFASNINGVVDSDEILLNTRLPQKLEDFMDFIGAKKGVITSGYRTAYCDRKVGGSGKGTSQHCLGNAVDIIFYDKNNKVIDTKLVSCKAQDFGFTGIARISNTATHLDIRETGKYYGDEMTGHTNTVTKDFYSYYHIDRTNKDIEKVCKKFGLDNDFWQKNYNTDLGKDCIIDLFNKIALKLQ